MSTNKVILTLDIWHDIKRYFLVYSLLALVVLSAFAVIFFTHLNRQSTSQIEVLLTQRDALENEWRNLLLEQNSLAEHSAIETKAEKELYMTKPDKYSEVIVELQ